MMESLAFCADVLVVDDDAFFRATIADRLRDANLKVMVAQDGQQALEMMASNDFDAVVCDLLMPNVDGIEVLRRVNVDFPETEVIILTASADIDIALRCLRLGAFDFVRKEKDLPELVSTVQRAIERRHLSQAHSLHATTKIIFASEDRRDLPERIIAVATKVMDADDSSLMLPDINGELYVAFSDGLPNEITESTRVILGEGIAGRVARERTPAVIQGHPTSDSRFAGTVASCAREVLSSIVFPLCSGDNAIGVLSLNRTGATRRPFRNNDLHRVSLLASQIVLALENQQLMRRVTATDKFTAVGQLSTGIAHEINNPISFIIANAEYVQVVLEKVIRDHCDRASVPGHLEEHDCLASFGGTSGIEDLCTALADIRDGGIRIRDVVRDLRGMVRGDDGTKEPFLLSDSVHAALRICAAQIRPVAEPSIEIDSQLVVMGCRGLMSQVFVNLFLNAVYAIREQKTPKGRLVIKGFCDQGEAIVEVTDNGAGMSPKQLARIFEPFYTTKPIGEGTGLGLPTSRDIIKWHGGEMRVHSTVGEGTTFKITLPSVDMNSSAITGEATPQPPTFAKDTCDRLRVLVVDDEPSICRSFVRSLSELEIVPANSGPAALQILRDDQEFAAILSDVVMPEMSGMAFLQAIEDRYPDLAKKFIFMTGSVGYADIGAYAKTRCVQVLEKPVDMTVLREALRALWATPTATST